MSVNLTENTTPTALSATASSSNEIDLSWTAPEDDDSRPSVTGHLIDISLNDGVTWEKLELQRGGTNTMYSHSGLNSSTNYCYRVWAVYPYCRGRRASASVCTATP